MSEATTARLSESQFQRQVIDVATVYGWLHYHTHNSHHSAAGYPDLTLVRGSRLIFAELKTEHGRLTADQKTWLEALTATGTEVHVWRPSRWEEIVLTLKRRGTGG